MMTLTVPAWLLGVLIPYFLGAILFALIIGQAYEKEIMMGRMNDSPAYFGLAYLLCIFLSALWIIFAIGLIIHAIWEKRRG